MDTQPRPLTCYIAALNRPPADPRVAAGRAVSALVSFAIPDFGILFRTRSNGSLIDLEFRALFALMGFVQNRLSSEEVAALRVFSSNPEFIFALAPDSPHLRSNKKRADLLQRFRRDLELTVEYVRAVDNQALQSPADLPAMPRGAIIAFSEDPAVPRPGRANAGSGFDVL